MADINTRPNLHLTSGPLLARNTIWNLIGNGAPMVVAVFAMPVLIHGLGKDRFGVLALAWALIGYASFFDMGLGRALTQLVANKLGSGEEQEVPKLVWTSLFLMLALGGLGAAIVSGISPWLIHRALKIPQEMQTEVLHGFYLVGLSVPVVIGTAALRGLLEAYQKFGIINVLRIPMGVFSYLGPLLVLPFSKSIFAVIAVLVVGRVVAWVIHFLVCFKAIPSLRHQIRWDRSVARPLLRFGSWMTVSNIISPLMVTMDRFVIGSLLSVAAVAYYTTPYEMVSKLWLIPASLLGVMFPAFSTSFVRDPKRTELLYRRSVRYLLLALFPLILVIITLAQDGLRVWLGADFALHSFRALQWLAVGIFINGLAAAPFAVVQGAGRPDLTAKLHLIELPAYLITLFWLIRAQGIEGAAMAWTGRVAFDALVLFILARRFLPIRSSTQLQTLLLIMAALGIFVTATLLHSWEMKGLFLILIFLGFILVGWFVLLSPEERKLAQQFP